MFGTCSPAGEAAVRLQLLNIAQDSSLVNDSSLFMFGLQHVRNALTRTEPHDIFIQYGEMKESLLP
jgi:hypothetical protein